MEEIDPYVRQHGNFLPAADIRIHHYFNPSTSAVAQLWRELIRPAGRNGRYYLKVN